MKEKIRSASEQSSEAAKSNTPSKLFPEAKTTHEEVINCVQGNETIIYSELLTSDHDCPLSSMLNLPLSKGATGISTSSTSTVAHPPEQQYIPIHYPYQQEAVKKPDEAMVISDALNFGDQALAIQNTCSQQAEQNTPSYVPANQLFEMKQEPPFHGVEMKSESIINALEVLQGEKQFTAPRMGRISSPIREFLKSGENNRKRQRTSSDGSKSAFQRKMDHLDKEKERRLRQTKCYDYLRSLVPCGSLKTDKANILEAAVAYLTYIKDTLGTTMEVIDKNFLDDFERNKDYSE